MTRQERMFYNRGMEDQETPTPVDAQETGKRKEEEIKSRKKDLMRPDIEDSFLFARRPEDEGLKRRLQREVDEVVESIQEGEDLVASYLIDKTTDGVWNHPYNYDVLGETFVGGVDSARKLDEPGEDAKLLFSLDALSKQLGGEGYELDIDFPEDATEEEKKKLIGERLKEDLKEIPELIAARELRDYVLRRAETNLAIQDTGQEVQKFVTGEKTRKEIAESEAELMEASERLDETELEIALNARPGGDRVAELFSLAGVRGERDKEIIEEAKEEERAVYDQEPDDQLADLYAEGLKQKTLEMYGEEAVADLDKALDDDSFKENTWNQLVKGYGFAARDKKLERIDTEDVVRSGRGEQLPGKLDRLTELDQEMRDVAAQARIAASEARVQKAKEDGSLFERVKETARHRKVVIDDWARRTAERIDRANPLSGVSASEAPGEIFRRAGKAVDKNIGEKVRERRISTEKRRKEAEERVRLKREQILAERDRERIDAKKKRAEDKHAAQLAKEIRREEILKESKKVRRFGKKAGQSVVVAGREKAVDVASRIRILRQELSEAKEEELRKKRETKKAVSEKPRKASLIERLRGGASNVQEAGEEIGERIRSHVDVAEMDDEQVQKLLAVVKKVGESETSERLRGRVSETSRKAKQAAESAEKAARTEAEQLAAELGVETEMISAYMRPIASAVRGAGSGTKETAKSAREAARVYWEEASEESEEEFEEVVAEIEERMGDPDFSDLADAALGFVEGDLNINRFEGPPEVSLKGREGAKYRDFVKVKTNDSKEKYYYYYWDGNRVWRESVNEEGKNISFGDAYQFAGVVDSEDKAKEFIAKDKGRDFEERGWEVESLDVPEDIDQLDPTALKRGLDELDVLHRVGDENEDLKPELQSQIKRKAEKLRDDIETILDFDLPEDVEPEDAYEKLKLINLIDNGLRNKDVLPGVFDRTLLRKQEVLDKLSNSQLQKARNVGIRESLIETYEKAFGEYRQKLQRLPDEELPEALDAYENGLRDFLEVAFKLDFNQEGMLAGPEEIYEERMVDIEEVLEDLDETPEIQEDEDLTDLQKTLRKAERNRETGKKLLRLQSKLVETDDWMDKTLPPESLEDDSGDTTRSGYLEKTRELQKLNLSLKEPAKSLSAKERQLKKYKKLLEERWKYLKAIREGVPVRVEEETDEPSLKEGLQTRLDIVRTKVEEQEEAQNLDPETVQAYKDLLEIYASAILDVDQEGLSDELKEELEEFKKDFAVGMGRYNTVPNKTGRARLIGGLDQKAVQLVDNLEESGLDTDQLFEDKRDSIEEGELSEFDEKNSWVVESMAELEAEEEGVEKTDQELVDEFREEASKLEEKIETLEDGEELENTLAEYLRRVDEFRGWLDSKIDIDDLEGDGAEGVYKTIAQSHVKRSALFDAENLSVSVKKAGLINYKDDLLRRWELLQEVLEVRGVSVSEEEGETGLGEGELEEGETTSDSPPQQPDKEPSTVEAEVRGKIADLEQQLKAEKRRYEDNFDAPDVLERSTRRQKELERQINELKDKLPEASSDSAEGKEEEEVPTPESVPAPGPEEELPSAAEFETGKEGEKAREWAGRIKEKGGMAIRSKFSKEELEALGLRGTDWSFKTVLQTGELKDDRQLDNTGRTVFQDTDVGASEAYWQGTKDLFDADAHWIEISEPRDGKQVIRILFQQDDKRRVVEDRGGLNSPVMNIVLPTGEAEQLTTEIENNPELAKELIIAQYGEENEDFARTLLDGIKDTNGKYRIIRDTDELNSEIKRTKFRKDEQKEVLESSSQVVTVRPSEFVEEFMSRAPETEETRPEPAPSPPEPASPPAPPETEEELPEEGYDLQDWLGDIEDEEGAEGEVFEEEESESEVAGTVPPKGPVVDAQYEMVEDEETPKPQDVEGEESPPAPPEETAEEELESRAPVPERKEGEIGIEDGKLVDEAGEEITPEKLIEMFQEGLGEGGAKNLMTLMREAIEKKRHFGFMQLEDREFGDKFIIFVAEGPYGSLYSFHEYTLNSGDDFESHISTVRRDEWMPEAEDEKPDSAAKAVGEFYNELDKDLVEPNVPVNKEKREELFRELEKKQEEAPASTETPPKPAPESTEEVVESAAPEEETPSPKLESPPTPPDREEDLPSEIEAETGEQGKYPESIENAPDYLQDYLKMKYDMVQEIKGKIEDIEDEHQELLEQAEASAVERDDVTLNEFIRDKEKNLGGVASLFPDTEGLKLDFKGEEIEALGAGASRVVFGLDDERVMKVSERKEDAWQEVLAYNLIPEQSRDLLAKPIQHGSFQVVETTERGSKVERTYYYQIAERLKSTSNEGKIPQFTQRADRLRNEIIPELGQGDLEALSNWGERDDGSIAILDYMDWRAVELRKEHKHDFEELELWEKAQNSEVLQLMFLLKRQDGGRLLTDSWDIIASGKYPLDLVIQDLEGIKSAFAGSGRADISNFGEVLTRLRYLQEGDRERAFGERPGVVENYTVSKIGIDEEKFQFREKTRDIEADYWDPILAETVQVWEDPEDGNTYVVDGHHRVKLAKKLGVEGIKVEKIEASTVEEARLHGAILNLSYGKITTSEAARFMREAGGIKPEHLVEMDVPLDNPDIQRALDMSNLTDELFEEAIDQINKSPYIAAGKLKKEDQKPFIELMKNNDFMKPTGSMRKVVFEMAEMVEKDGIDVLENFNHAQKRAWLIVQTKKQIVHDENFVRKYRSKEVEEGVDEVLLERGEEMERLVDRLKFEENSRFSRLLDEIAEGFPAASNVLNLDAERGNFKLFEVYRYQDIRDHLLSEFEAELAEMKVEGGISLDEEGSVDDEVFSEGLDMSEIVKPSSYEELYKQIRGKELDETDIERLVEGTGIKGRWKEMHVGSEHQRGRLYAVFNEDVGKVQVVKFAPDKKTAPGVQVLFGDERKGVSEGLYQEMLGGHSSYISEGIDKTLNTEENKGAYVVTEYAISPSDYMNMLKESGGSDEEIENAQREMFNQTAQVIKSFLENDMIPLDWGGNATELGDEWITGTKGVGLSPESLFGENDENVLIYDASTRKVDAATSNALGRSFFGKTFKGLVVEMEKAGVEVPEDIRKTLEEMPELESWSREEERRKFLEYLQQHPDIFKKKDEGSGEGESGV